MERLPASISFGNCPNCTGLQLAIQNSGAIHHLSPCLFHNCSVKGKPHCPSEPVNGSSPGMLCSWLVWERQITFICLENFHSGIFRALSVSAVTPNSFWGSTVLLDAAPLTHFCTKWNIVSFHGPGTFSICGTPTAVQSHKQGCFVQLCGLCPPRPKECHLFT